MPTLNIESMDDPLLFDLCGSFAGGQASFTRANRIEANQAALLLNLDITRDGLVSTRRGTLLVGGPGQPMPVAGRRIQGLCYYDTPARQYLVAAVNGTLWTWDGNLWSNATIVDTNGNPYAAADAARPVAMAQGIDKLHIADGAGNLHIWDGTPRGLVNAGNNSGGSNTSPPIPRLLAWHTSRLFASGLSDTRDAVYASNLLDGSAWNTATQQIRVGAGDGDPVVALCPWIANELIVLKRHSMWDVSADPVRRSRDMADHPRAWPHRLCRGALCVPGGAGCLVPQRYGRPLHPPDARYQLQRTDGPDQLPGAGCD